MMDYPHFKNHLANKSKGYRDTRDPAGRQNLKRSATTIIN